MEKDTEKLNMSTIRARLKSETPRFWKKVRQYMIACGTVGAAIVGLPSVVPADYITWLYTWAPEHLGGTLVTIGVVGTALSSITKS